MRRAEADSSTHLADEDECAMTNNDDAPQTVAEGLALVHIAAEWLQRQRQ